MTHFSKIVLFVLKVTLVFKNGLKLESTSIVGKDGFFDAKSKVFQKIYLDQNLM